MNARAEARDYEDIAVGMVCSVQRTITREDVQVFATLTGDMNPLHTDERFGRESKFGQNIVHGMLAASFLSTLVGMHCPGQKSLFLSQTLQFRMPLFFGDAIEVRGTVVQKYDAIRVVRMKMEVLRGADTIVSGEARVQVSD